MKHDWASLKADFLTSKYVSVSEWAKEVLGKEMGKDGGLANATKGWTDEKKRMQEEIVARALEEHKRKMAEIYRPSIKELGEMHKALISLVKASINHEMNECFDKETGRIKKAPSLNVINSNWKLVKTEKGEATSVVERAEPLTDDEKNFIDSVLDDLDE